MNRRVTRAIATGVVVLAMLIGVFSFAPTRALARQFLSVFRVRKFAVVQVDPNQDQMEAVVNALSDTLISQEPEVYVDEPATSVADVTEASALAGFEVRMPSYMPGFQVNVPGEIDVDIEVKGRTEVGMTLGQDSLKVLFELAGMDPGLAPNDLGDGVIRAMIPSAVMIQNERYSLMQMLDPVVEYPEGVDPVLIGEAGLRIMGLSEDEAQRLSQSIDWANTMLLPVPTDMLQVRETVVAGSAAVLMIPAEGQDRPTLIWEHDDVVYVLNGAGAHESLVRIAESMYD